MRWRYPPHKEFRTCVMEDVLPLLPPEYASVIRLGGAVDLAIVQIGRGKTAHYYVSTGIGGAVLAEITTIVGALGGLHGAQHCARSMADAMLWAYHHPRRERRKHRRRGKLRRKRRA